MRKCSLFLLCFLLTLGGCSFVSRNNDLNGFCERMNTLYEEKIFSPDGYIIDEENSAFYRFFQFDKNEVFLKFRYDENFSLTEMSITFEKGAQNEKSVFRFVENCLKAFINNENIYDNLFKKINLTKTLCENTLNTKETEIENIKMCIDVSDIGSVISVTQII